MTFCLNCQSDDRINPSDGSLTPASSTDTQSERVGVRKRHTATLAVFLGTDCVGRSALIGSLNLEQEVAGALFTAVVTAFLQANTCSYNHTHTHRAEAGTSYFLLLKAAQF